MVWAREDSSYAIRCVPELATTTAINRGIRYTRQYIIAQQGMAITLWSYYNLIALLWCVYTASSGIYRRL